MLKKLGAEVNRAASGPALYSNAETAVIGFSRNNNKKKPNI
jgi:hypothetical protein